MKSFSALALVSVATFICSSQQVAASPVSEVVLASEVEWEQLNPARGDQSPKAATLWGDRKGTVPTGFLVQFTDGFSSPPHIHHVSYRGVVISGLIHNDDPDAADMWMPTGSFWTQPKGETHITAAKGRANMAYIEIEAGPYLVLPPTEAFDSGERPLNVDASNIVWVEASDALCVDRPGTSASANGPRVAILWGSPQEGELHGALIKLPAGFTGEIRSYGSTFRAVVIDGQPRYQAGETAVKTLEPGSYISSEGEQVHQVSSNAEDESIFYVRTDGQFEINPVPQEN